MEAYITESPYGESSIEDCVWYHGYGFLHGKKIDYHYDLEPILHNFLLPKKMKGNTFLDIGTASGFFSFEMERRGAEVVSFDLGLDEKPDTIPYPNSPDRSDGYRDYFRKIHKGYWYAHRQLRSRAKAVYGTVMRMPEWLGRFDLTLLGSILQHLRDPLGAIIEADRHTKKTLIISEAYYASEEPILRFQAQPDSPDPQYWTWWLMSPSFLVTALKTLGYRDIEVCGPFDMYNVGGKFNVPTITVKGTK